LIQQHDLGAQLYQNSFADAARFFERSCITPWRRGHSGKSLAARPRRQKFGAAIAAKVWRRGHDGTKSANSLRRSTLVDSFTFCDNMVSRQTRFLFCQAIKKNKSE
jgi:hypothetical protein